MTAIKLLSGGAFILRGMAALWIVLLCFCALALIARAAEQQDAWLQFRGRNLSGIGDGTFPTHFGPETNLLWKLETPQGHSSPCIWGTRIFLTGFDEGKLETVCLDRTSGKQLWSKTLDPGAIERSARLSHPATGTPATDGKAVYVYFGSFGLAAYDFNGKELWGKPLPIPVTQHGPGTSPVVADGKVYLACDQDTQSYLICVKSEDGETVWLTDRPGFKRGFATPLLFPPEHPQQLILPGSLRLLSYNISDGSERWRISGLPNEMVSSAITGDGLIFLTGWTSGSGVRSMPSFDSLLAFDADKSGTLTRAEIPNGPAKQHFLYLDANKDGQLTRDEYQQTAALFDRSQNAGYAIRPDGKGDVTETHILWKTTKGLPYCPTPLYYEGRLFFVKNGGLATCLDARTGSPHYQEERLGALGDYYSSPVAADGKICVISQPGMAVILKSGDTLEILAKNDLHEEVVATPAIVDNKIFIRASSHLYSFGTPPESILK